MTLVVTDNGHSFDQVLYYGHELTLTTFEILLFGFVDMLSSQGFVLSAIVTYFVSLVSKNFSYNLIKTVLGLC